MASVVEEIMEREIDLLVSLSKIFDVEIQEN
jgi:hypothetical protein